MKSILRCAMESKSNNIQNPRKLSTLVGGYMDSKHKHKHPQVLEKTINGEVNVENNKCGLTHKVPSEKKQEELGLPVIQKYNSLGKDLKDEKTQFAVFFKDKYTKQDLNSFKEDENITKYLNREGNLSQIKRELAYQRALNHREEYIKLSKISEKQFKDCFPDIVDKD